MPTTSQGIDYVPNATKLSIKGSRASASDNKLDSSTLELAHGSDRTYENGLTDNGQTGGDGITYTASASGLGTAPEVGDTFEYDGKTLTCIDSSRDANVGELMAWSANYTSDYEAE